MNQVTEKELTLHDFAFHDPLLDLCAKDTRNYFQELKELLIKNNQKKALKKGSRRIK
jgi:hypothetical protein